MRIILYLTLLLTISAAKVYGQTFTMTQIGPDFFLDVPWDLHYGPDDHLWVTERRSGRVIRVNPETEEIDELITINTVFDGQSGLLGIALHDNVLTTDPYVFLSYSYNDDGLRQRIVRYTYNQDGEDGSLSSPVILIESLPASDDHNSGRLIYDGSEDVLYYSIGDQGNRTCSNHPSQALPSQEEIDNLNFSKYPGKILRIKTDGSIPPDNPIFNGVQSHIYSIGHRNPQGLTLGSNGTLYSSEHGPSSDDEVNIILSGQNYGWPIVAGPQDNTHDDGVCNPEDESSLTDENYQEPLLSMFLSGSNDGIICNNDWMCRPNIAPASLAIYEHQGVESWGTSLLVPSLKKGRIYRLPLNEDGNELMGEVEQLFYTTNRYRDIAISPDGKSIYIITDQTGNTADASGNNRTSNLSNPGAILKFTLDSEVDTKDVIFENVFTIRPNPVVNNYFEIDLKASEPYRLEFYNQLGKLIKVEPNLKYGTNSIDITTYPKGIYYCKLSSPTKSFVKEVIIP